MKSIKFNHIHHYFCMLAVLALTIWSMTGCTTNNGDIGPYYGVWNVDKILPVESTVGTSWNADGNFTTFAFQNNIIAVSLSNEFGNIQQQWGTWRVDNNSITFDFTHHDNTFGPDGYMYGAPEWIGFANGINVLSIKKLDGRKMVLSLNKDDGMVYTYYLSKQY